jgi:hypothetical protein
MGNDTTNQEDIEIRIIRELTDIKLELQELRQMHTNSELKVKMSISEHQAQCPMMHKRPVLEGQSYEEWKKCQAQHIKESGRSFDIWYDRTKKIGIAVLFIYAILQSVNAEKLMELLK